MIREVEATITAKTQVGSQWRYGWKQIMPDSITGVPSDPLTAWEGSTALNYALERNNQEVSTGTRVTLRQWGWVGGQTVWVFSGPGSSGTPGVFGQAYTFPSTVAVWDEENGQWLASRSATITTAQNSSSSNIFMEIHRDLDSIKPPGTPTQQTLPRVAFGITANQPWVVPGLGYDHFLSMGLVGPSLNGWFNYTFFKDGESQSVNHQYSIKGVGGTIGVSVQGGVIVITPTSTSIRYQMPHWNSFGQQGLTGSLPGGAGYAEGIITSHGTVAFIDSGNFEDGLLTAKIGAITPLAGGASSTDIINKVNELITALRTIGLMF